MIYTKAVFALLINVILLQCCFLNTMAYTQISTSGRSADDGVSDGGGPKIYKAVNFDLIFPKSFNSSENVISTTPENIPSPTKTATAAFVGQPYYPLAQSNEPTYTATAVEQREPTLYITPAPPPSRPAAAPITTAPSNEAGIYDTQQNTNSNNYNEQVVTQNAINIQQQQLQQQLTDNNKAEKEQEPEQQQQQQYLATGRAVDYHTGYPFGQLITPLIKNAPRPVYRKPVTSYSTFPSSSSVAAAAAKLAAAPSNVGKIIYPQAMYQQKPPSQAEIDKLRGKATFRDRFSPSEGVASHTFKSNHDHSHDHNHHNHAPSYTPVGKTPSASNVVNSYVPPSNLYSFPPNNVNYPSQSQDTKDALPSGKVNSYSAPASGPLKNSNYNLDTSSSNSSPYQYNGPVSAGYLPPSNGGDDGGDNGGGKDEGKNNDGAGDGDLDNGGGDDSVGVLPASAMDQAGDGNGGDDNGDMSSDIAGDMGGDMAGSMDTQDAPDDHSYDTGKEYPTPPPGWLKEHPEAAQDHPHHDHHPEKPDIEFDHSHDHHHQPDIIFDHDHDHDHYHHSYPSYPSYPSYHHHYPEIIYDDHHHDHHVEPPPPTTTEAPLPEPPPEPRVKKYSYFYIGRKLWYIPLYFTIWFSFYVLWLILKSIARHKVNLPNHYVSRRSVNYDFSKNKQETLNQLTVSVLDQIDKFKRKYMN